MPTEFHTKRRIEFSDVDLAGFVHFSRFFVFMETAEHEFLRSLGTSVHMIVDGKEIGWPRLSASCDYLNPVRFEDEIDIHLVVARKGKKSMTYKFTFTRKDQEVAKGEISSACCLVDPVEGFRTIPIPQEIASQINDH
jgi:YbgC/YbaW family acyl-CoA thioester hydrolase